MGLRFNQPTCLSLCHPGVDKGTLNRNLSTPPGPVGQVAEGFLDLIGEGASWTGDSLGLYSELAKEGLGFLADVYGGKKSGGALPIAEALDRRLGNMGRAHNEFSRKHKIGAMSTFNALARWFAGDDEMKRRCLDHYVWGQGSEMELTLEEMKLMNTYFDLFETENYSPKLSAAIEQANKGKSVPVNTQVSGQNKALGNFTIHIKGVIKPATGQSSGPLANAYYTKTAAKETDVALMFEGEMSWSDYWDFDPKVAQRFQEKRSGRPATAEAAVDAVAALVDGVPFNVTSNRVSMKQYSGRFPIY